MPLSPTDPRRPLVDHLTAACAADRRIHAAWLGGSDATGRTDSLSDVDLVVLADDDAVDAVLGALEGEVARIAPIALRWRVPEPAWHGHSQVFLQLEGWDPCHMVDLVVIRRSSDPATWFLEPLRHGSALVLFDRAGLAVPTTLDRAAHDQALRRRRDELIVKFGLFEHLVGKAIRRGDLCEAVDRYHAIVLRSLVELLRMRHCPERYDFGLRYLERDLPPEVHAEVVALALIPSREALDVAYRRAVRRFNEEAKAASGSTR